MENNIERDEALRILKLSGDGKHCLEDHECDMLQQWFYKYVLTDEHKQILNKYGYSISDLDEGRTCGEDDVEKLKRDCNEIIGSMFFFDDYIGEEDTVDDWLADEDIHCHGCGRDRKGKDIFTHGKEHGPIAQYCKDSESCYKSARKFCENHTAIDELHKLHTTDFITGETLDYNFID